MPGEQGKTVTHGLILRDTDTKETDKILTVLTAEMGKISVIAGALGGKTAAWPRPASSLPGRK